MNLNNLKKRWACEHKERKERACSLRRILAEQGVLVFKKYGIRKVILFGSFIDERCLESSDVDILVVPLDNNKYWEFLHELEETVNFSIDLYTDKDDSVFVQKIMERGEVVYEV